MKIEIEWSCGIVPGHEHGSFEEAQRCIEMHMKTRAGRVLSGSNENKLRAAVEALQEVLAQLGGDDEGRAMSRDVAAYTRYFELSEVQVRTETVGAAPTITGYAAVFNSLSVDMGGWREQILPGAFGAGLGGDIRALWQHDSARVLGRTRNNTLQLSEDAKGLAFEITPPDTQDGRDALALLRRGDVDQMSFGFFVPPGGDSWESRDAGDGKMLLHTLKQVELVEVSVVTWPAYPATSAGVMRNAPEWVRRALQDCSVTDSEGDEARARLELEHAWLELLEMTGRVR